MNSESKTLAGVKLRAKKLEAHLKSQGISIKHGQVLEAIAAEDNYPSWNHYASDLSKNVSSELSKSIDFVIGVPGSGSASIFHLHALYLIQKNPKGFVTIFSGYENYSGYTYPLFKEKMVYCEISLEDLSEPEAWINKNEGLLKNIDGKVLWVNFKHQKGLPLSSAVYADWLIATNNMLALLPCKAQNLHKMDISFPSFNTQELFTPWSQFSNYIGVENWTFYLSDFEYIPRKNHSKVEMNVYLSISQPFPRILESFKENISSGINYYFLSHHPIEKIIDVKKLESVQGWVEWSLQASGLNHKNKTYKFSESSSDLNFVEDFRGWLSNEGDEHQKYERALEIVKREMPHKRLLSYSEVKALNMIAKWSNPKTYEAYWNKDQSSKKSEKKEKDSRIVTVLAEMKLGEAIRHETILVDMELEQIMAISG